MSKERFKKYSSHEKYNVLFDTVAQTFCIKSKERLDNKVMIVGFITAASAIEFAEVSLNETWGFEVLNKKIKKRKKNENSRKIHNSILSG
jgi:hypothetical protein